MNTPSRPKNPSSKRTTNSQVRPTGSPNNKNRRPAPKPYKGKRMVSQRERELSEKAWKKRSFKAFKNGLLIYIFILLFISIGILTYMWISLSSYQKKVDEENAAKEYSTNLQRAPQLYFEDYFANLSEDDWIDIWYENNPYKYNSKDEVRSFLKENILTCDKTLFKSADYFEAAPVYLLKCNDESIARFYLEGSALDWKVTKRELLLQGQNSSTIEVPNGTILSINSAPVDESFVTKEGHSVNVPSYKDQLNNPVSYSVYTVENLIAECDFNVESSNDNLDIVTDDSGVYCFALKSDAALSYKDKADKFIKALLYYYKMGKVDTSANLSAVTAQVAKGSEAATVIKQSYDGVLWRFSYPNITYQTETSPVYVLADNCYCVDVTYVSSEDTEKAESYRVYFLDLGDGFKIYNFALN